MKSDFILCSAKFFVSVQYLVTLGGKLLKWRRNPKCSTECCLSLVLTLQEVGQMATSTQQPQLHRETFGEDLAVPELATATADVEEKEEKDVVQKHGVKSVTP